MPVLESPGIYWVLIWWYRHSPKVHVANVTISFMLHLNWKNCDVYKSRVYPQSSSSRMIIWIKELLGHRTNALYFQCCQPWHAIRRQALSGVETILLCFQKSNNLAKFLTFPIERFKMWLKGKEIFIILVQIYPKNMLAQEQAQK